jgi:hypothetical protein
MLSVQTILTILIIVIFIIGVVLLVIYYKDNDENKSSGLLITGWILLSPGLFFLAIGFIYIFFHR